MSDSNEYFKGFELDSLIKAIKNEEKQYSAFKRYRHNCIYANEKFGGYMTRGIATSAIFATILGFTVMPNMIPESMFLGTALGIGVTATTPAITKKMMLKRPANYHQVLEAINYLSQDLEASKTVMGKEQKKIVSLVETERKKGVDLRRDKIDCLSRYRGCLASSFKVFDNKLIDLEQTIAKAEDKGKDVSDVYEFGVRIDDLLTYIMDLRNEANYVVSFVSGEREYDPEMTRGNKLLSYVDSKNYEQQVRKYRETAKEATYDRAEERFENVQTIERGM